MHAAALFHGMAINFMMPMRMFAAFFMHMHMSSVMVTVRGVMRSMAMMYMTALFELAQFNITSFVASLLVLFSILHVVKVTICNGLRNSTAFSIVMLFMSMSTAFIAPIMFTGNSIYNTTLSLIHI